MPAGDRFRVGDNGGFGGGFAGLNFGGLNFFRGWKFSGLGQNSAYFRASPWDGLEPVEGLETQFLANLFGKPPYDDIGLDNLRVNKRFSIHLFRDHNELS